MDNSSTNELLTMNEVAKILKISRSKAYSLTQENDFPMIKIGKCIRVNKKDLYKWLHI